MGNTQATVSSCERAIYQVTSVTRLSPGAECGLQAQDDFLVAINGKELINMSMESMMVIVKVRRMCNIHDQPALQVCV